MARNKHIGSNVDDFLEEQGLLDHADAVATKRIVAWQIAQLMNKKRLSKSEMARRMQTSRAALDRLLDPDNPSVTLQTLQGAARALGKRLAITIR